MCSKHLHMLSNERIFGLRSWLSENDALHQSEMYTIDNHRFDFRNSKIDRSIVGQIDTEWTLAPAAKIIRWNFQSTGFHYSSRGLSKEIFPKLFTQVRQITIRLNNIVRLKHASTSSSDLKKILHTGKPIYQ